MTVAGNAATTPPAGGLVDRSPEWLIAAGTAISPMAPATPTHATRARRTTGTRVTDIVAM